MEATVVAGADVEMVEVVVAGAEVLGGGTMATMLDSSMLVLVALVGIRDPASLAAEGRGVGMRALGGGASPSPAVLVSQSWTVFTSSRCSFRTAFNSSMSLFRASRWLSSWGRKEMASRMLRSYSRKVWLMWL